MSGTLVWISGATAGVGAGLAHECPYPGARLVNLSRSEAAGMENVRLDLGDESTWQTVAQHFDAELSAFDGDRVIFVHNAFHAGTPSFVGEGHGADHAVEHRSNFTASLVLGEAFVEAVARHRPHITSGLVMLSSASARIPFEGRSSYCAAKAGIEQWVRVVRRERKARGTGPWVVAVRPGFVDTPGLRADARADARDYPIGPAVARALASGDSLLTPEQAARDIWAALPDGGPSESVLLFGSPPEGARRATPM
ncbi:MAG TPA: SDR family NAD(P)-dependent oxidoreductase [Mycobacteriales bacterium]|nr:SDR family NAD(P)-dependent oxidoreductase [Mycobacteriales bacterium]